MVHNCIFCTASVCCILQGRRAVFEQAMDRIEKIKHHSHRTQNKSSSDSDADAPWDWRICIGLNRILLPRESQSNRCCYFQHAWNARNVTRFICESFRAARTEAIFLFRMHNLVCTCAGCGSLKRKINGAGPGKTGSMKNSILDVLGCAKLSLAQLIPSIRPSTSCSTRRHLAISALDASSNYRRTELSISWPLSINISDPMR